VLTKANDELSQLRARVAELEEENRRLKDDLKRAQIALRAPCAHDLARIERDEEPME